MKCLHRWLALALAAAWLSGWIQPAAPALAGDPYALIDAVNQLRAANGLYAYSIDSILMDIAYGQSAYQAELGTWSHTGPGGTNETQRAVAAGYGSSGSVRCDENVAYGLNLSPQGAVEMWMDPVHLAIMLSTRYVDAGAGAFTDANGRIYYTLDVCIKDGSAPGPVVGAGTPLPTYPPYFSVQTSTPNPDGTIIHKVRPGQTLIGIAKAYEIKLDELLALNNLKKDSLIYPNQELVVRTVPTPTETLLPTQSPTPPPPTPTRRSTRTPTPTVSFTLPPQLLSESQEERSTSSAQGDSLESNPARVDNIGNAILLSIGVLIAVGVGMIALGGLLRRGN